MHLNAKIFSRFDPFFTRAVPEPVATGPGGRRRRHNRHNVDP